MILDKYKQKPKYVNLSTVERQFLQTPNKRLCITDKRKYGKKNSQLKQKKVL